MAATAVFHPHQAMASTSYLPPQEVMPAPLMMPQQHLGAMPAMSAPQAGKIQAYAALEFPNFSFYIKKLSITIGRMPPMLVLPSGAVQPTASSHHSSGNNSRASPLSIMKPVVDSSSYFSPRLLPLSAARSTSPLLGESTAKAEPAEFDGDLLKQQNPRPRSATPSDPPPAYSAQAPADRTAKIEVCSTTTASDDVHPDVDLGPIKAVSRDHARCYYDTRWACWALEVRGRNGLVVEGRWRAKDDVIMLSHRMKIQIAEHIFFFVLPDSVVETNRNSPYHSDSESSSDGEVKISDDDELESITDGASQSQSIPAPTKMTNGSRPSDKRLKLARDEDIEALELDTSTANRQRKPSAKLVASSAPATTPIETPAASTSTKAPVKKTVKKTPSTNNAVDTKASEPKASTSAVASTNGTTKKEKTSPTAKPAKTTPKRTKGKRRAAPADGEMDLDPSTYSIWPLRKPSNEFVDGNVKPPYSFPSLIGQCMHYNSDKKLTSAVIQEWIASVYPWYDQNRDKVGWLNSVQQHLSTNKGFVKTPRRSDEPGKGNFWVYDESVNLTFDGISDDEDDDGAPPRPTVSTGTTNPQTGVPTPAAQQPKKAAPRPTPAKPPAKQTIKISNTPANTAPAQHPQALQKPVLARPVNPNQQQQPIGQPIASTSARPAGNNPGPVGAPQRTGPPPIVHPVRIVVGPIPATYKPPPPKPNVANDEVAAQLLKDPPIVLHEGALILSPAIFGQMKPEQLIALSKLGAAKALSILQSYIVQHFKEKLKKNKKAATPPVQNKPPGQPITSAQPNVPRPQGTVPIPQNGTSTIQRPPQTQVQAQAQPIPSPAIGVKRKLDVSTASGSSPAPAAPVAKKQAL